MDIVFMFSTEDDKLVGTLSSQKQQLKDLPMSSIRFDPPNVTLVVPMAGGQWEGKLSGDSLKGTWIQGPYQVPLNLQKLVDKPQLEIRERKQTPVPPFPYLEEEISYLNYRDQTRLAATLTIPAGEGPFPAAILLTVAGPIDRNQSHGAPPHKPYMVLADYLARQGIAVLRSDDRGVGGSSGELFQSTIEDFARDAVAAFTYLKNREEIDPLRIGFIGNSEGSLVGPLADSLVGEAAFIITLGGIGITGKQIILDQVVSLGELSGMNDQAIEDSKARTDKLFKILNEEPDSIKAANRIMTLIQESEGQSNPIFLIPQDPVQRVQLFNSPWYRYQVQYDPATVLQGLTCPFLALHGDKDPFVHPDENLGAIARHLQIGGNPHYALNKLKNVNHVMQDATSGSPLDYNNNEISFSPRALEIIYTWLKGHVISGK